MVAGSLKKPEDIAGLVLRGTDEGSGELITVGDLAEVREGYLEPPSAIMRCNGLPAVGLFFNDPATTEIYTISNTLSLHDALPISKCMVSLNHHKS